jgi:hypothetical protein
MVLCLKARESRSLPGLPSAKRPLRIRRSTRQHGFDAGWSSPVARQAHNLKVVGSNPAPATKSKKAALTGRFFVVWCQALPKPAAYQDCDLAPALRISANCVAHLLREFARCVVLTSVSGSLQRPDCCEAGHLGTYESYGRFRRASCVRLPNPTAMKPSKLFAP